MMSEQTVFTPIVDIIIPTYNNVTSLLKTLRSFESQSEKRFLIHICIDGSSKETIAEISVSNLPLQYLIHTHHHDEHRGRNATRNLALNHLMSEFIITVDSDSEVSNTFIEEHLNVVNEQTVSVGIFSYTNTKTNLWANYLQNRGNARFSHLEIIPYYYFKTGNASFPKKFFVELHGQDPKMIGYGGGDTEFSIRMNNSFSPKYVCNGKAIAYSEMDKSLSFALDQFLEFGSDNLLYILSKHPNETSIFSIKKILFSPIYRLLLQFPFKQFFVNIIPFFPQLLRTKLIHICVASQIVRGYFSGKNI